MAEITWSNDAILDLQRIFNSLVEGSPAYAEKLVYSVYNRVLILAQHPRLGRVVPEWEHPDFREGLYRPYRIIYEIRDHEIIIHAVIHGRRLLD